MIQGPKKYAKLKKEAEKLILSRNEVKVVDEEKIWLKGGQYKESYAVRTARCENVSHCRHLQTEKRKRRHLETPEDYVNEIVPAGHEDALPYMIVGGYHADSPEDLEEIATDLKQFLKRKKRELKGITKAAEEEAKRKKKDAENFSFDVETALKKSKEEREQKEVAEKERKEKEAAEAAEKAIRDEKVRCCCCCWRRRRRRRRRIDCSNLPFKDLHQHIQYRTVN
jgi:hypothetical protein